MLKADVLAKLELYKGRPVEIGLSDEGALLHANIEGHWLFVEGDNLVEIKKNTGDGTYGFSTAVQQYSPFSITTVPFDIVNYVKSYITNKPDDVSTLTNGLEPVGTDKSLDDIIKEIESDSIRKAVTPRGNLNTPNVAPGTVYGEFKGSAVSTELDGIPAYMKDALLNK